MGTIELDLLPLFLAVAETGSFSTAAKRLGLPKSSVSRGIARLEAALGVRLLHRTTRSVALSTAGTALYERTAPLMSQLRGAVEDLPELDEQPSGTLRITATPDLAVAVLADVVARFALRYPAVELDLHMTNRRLDLVAEGIDLAFRFGGELPDSTLVAREVSGLRAGLYAAPSYLARRKAPRAPADLDGHDWVVFRTLREITLEREGKRATVRPKGRLTVDDMLVARTLVEQGAGIGLLPRFLASGQCATGALAEVLPPWTTSGGRLWMVTPGGRHVPRKVAAFREFFLDAVRLRPTL